MAIVAPPLEPEAPPGPALAVELELLTPVELEPPALAPMPPLSAPKVVLVAEAVVLPVVVVLGPQPEAIAPATTTAIKPCQSLIG